MRINKMNFFTLIFVSLAFYGFVVLSLKAADDKPSSGFEDIRQQLRRQSEQQELLLHSIDSLLSSVEGQVEKERTPVNESDLETTKTLTSSGSNHKLQRDVEFLQRGFRAEKVKRAVLEKGIETIRNKMEDEFRQSELLKRFVQNHTVFIEHFVANQTTYMETLVVTQTEIIQNLITNETKHVKSIVGNQRAYFENLIKQQKNVAAKQMEYLELMNGKIENIATQIAYLNSNFSEQSHVSGFCSPEETGCTGPNCCLNRTLDLIYSGIQLMQNDMDSLSHTMQKHVLRDCPLGYTFEENGHVCYKVHETCTPWQEAKEICNTEGTDLVVIKDENFPYFRDVARAENAKADCSAGFWVGASDVKVDREWKWVNGATVGQTFWAPMEPNGGRRENCAHLNPGANFYLNDIPCSESSVKFICGV